MITGDLIFVGILIVALFSVGGGVYLHDRKSFTARFFLALVSFMAIWLLSNFLSNYVKNEWLAIATNRLIFTSTTFAIWQLLIFTKNYPERGNIVTKRFFWISLVPTILVGIIGLTPLIVAGVQIRVSYSEIIFGTGIYAYIAHILFCLVLYVWVLIQKARTLQGIDKARLQYLFTGLTISTGGILLTNLVIPIFFNNFVLTNIGPAFLLLFVGFTAFSIIEIRLTGIRNLLFQITNLLILGLLPVLAFYLTRYLSKINFIHADATIEFALIFVIMTGSFLLISKSISVVRKFLQGDLMSTSIELEKIKNSFSSRISTELDLKKLSKLTCDIIRETVGVTDISITLLDLENKSVISHVNEGFKKANIVPEELLTFTTYWRRLHAGYVLVRDELEHLDESELTDLMRHALEFLKKHSIAIMIALNGSTQTHGFILIGEKINFNAYTSEEISFLTAIIANNASVAISRALLFERQKYFNSELNEKVKLRTKELEAAKLSLEDKNIQIRNAYHELKTLDNAKSEFISIASHQLRTPISIIKGYLSMILEGDFGSMPEPQLIALHKASDNIQQLNDIVEDILNASRIERGKMAISPDRTEIIELVRNVVEQLQPKADKKNLTLTYKGSIKEFTTLADRNKIYEVIINLVDNALNYTKEGSVTVITDNTPEGDLLIIVKDTGIGIPETFKDKMFQRFSRSDNAKSVRPDGTGIGLYVAKSFIDAHQGQIWFESTVNVGTTFFVKLLKNPVFPAAPSEETTPETKIIEAKKIAKETKKRHRQPQ